MLPIKVRSNAVLVALPANPNRCAKVEIKMKHKIHKIVLAFIQLETAISLFLNDKNYICAATLAGASEEILGKIAKNKDETDAYTILCEELIKDYKKELNITITKKELGDTTLNFFRNELKHFNKQKYEFLEINPESVAISLLLRACYNITLLNIMTENIGEFIRWANENLQRIHN